MQPLLRKALGFISSWTTIGVSHYRSRPAVCDKDVNLGRIIIIIIIIIVIINNIF